MSTKLPLGVESEYVHDQQRRVALSDAIQRYRDAGLEPNVEWLEELARLQERYRPRYLEIVMSVDEEHRPRYDFDGPRPGPGGSITLRDVRAYERLIQTAQSMDRIAQDEKFIVCGEAAKVLNELHSALEELG